MKKYSQKKRPVLRFPGGNNPKKDLVLGAAVLVVVFTIMILLSRESMFGETLAEYGQSTGQLEQRESK